MYKAKVFASNSEEDEVAAVEVNKFLEVMKEQHEGGQQFR